jgi:hypothetical protein
MSDYREAHLDAIHVTATSGTALTSSTKLEALKTFSLCTSTELVEQKHLNSSGWTSNTPTFKSGSGSLAGDVKKGSATQAVLVTADTNRTPFFVHVVEDESAEVGSKGWRYELVIESAEKPYEAGGLVTFSYAVKMNGPPVAI